MSLKRTLVKNTTLNLVGYIYVAIGSIVSVPILLSKLGPDSFGVYLLFSGLIPLAVSADFGLSTATIRRLSLPKITKSQKFKIWQSSLFLFLINAVIMSAVFFLISILFLTNIKALDPLSQAGLVRTSLLVSLIVFLNYLVIHGLSLPQARQNFFTYNLYPLIVGSGNTILPALLVQFFPNIQAIFLLRLSMYFILLILLLIYSYRYFKNNPLSPKFYRDSSKSLLNFGVKHFIGNLSNQLQNQFSRYAIGDFLSAGAVSIFTVPHQIIVNASGAISQATLAFFPMSTSLSTKERLPKLKKLILGLESLILLLGAIQVFLVHRWGEPVLVWWLNDPQFAAQAFEVLKILSWYFLITTLTPIPGAVLNSINKPHIPSIFAVLTTVITIGVIIYLTPILGATGPAYALVISSIITVPIFLFTFSIAFNKFQAKINNS